MLFRIIRAFIIFMLWSTAVDAGKFHVVVGTFSEEGGARDFAAALRSLFSEASFTYDSDRKLYHVHVMTTLQQEEAHYFKKSLQTDMGFADAWIFTDLYSAESSGGGQSAGSDPVTIELFTGGSVLLSSTDNSYLSISKEEKEKKSNVPAIPGMAFHLAAETAAGNSLSGEVLVLDKKGRKLSTFTTGETISLGGKELTHTLTFVCRVPGYHPETKLIDLSDFRRIPDIALDSNGVWKVRFRLTKLKVDEINLLCRNMFHPDAAVLQQESKKQLQVLHALLEANARWRIVINSHCNAGLKREIFMPRTGGDPFDTDDSEGRPGTDKLLTTARGEALRDYLIDRGIDRKRISVMGWGSLNRLVKATDENAFLNDRVEIVFGR